MISISIDEAKVIIYWLEKSNSLIEAPKIANELKKRLVSAENYILKFKEKKG